MTEAAVEMVYSAADYRPVFEKLPRGQDSRDEVQCLRRCNVRRVGGITATPSDETYRRRPESSSTVEVPPTQEAGDKPL